jgi:anti-sigma factor RsiW
LEKHDLTCEEAAGYFDRLLEGDLAPGDEEILRAHLAVCKVCRAQYALDLTLISSIGTAPREAFESVAGAVAGRIRTRERRGWVFRWGAVVAAVSAIAYATWQVGEHLSEPVQGLLSGGLKSSPTYLALSKITDLVIGSVRGLGTKIVAGRIPGGLEAYAPQVALVVLITGAIVLFMMYGMGRWLKKPVEVNSWRRG